MRHSRRDEDLFHVACVLVILFFMCACSSAPRVPDAAPEAAPPQSTVPTVPEAPAPPAEPDTTDADYAVLMQYAVPEGYGADVLEEQAWRAAFHQFRETVIKQCMYGGCRFEVPDEYNFILSLKMQRDLKRSTAVQGE